jgi:hypothetical protein
MILILFISISINDNYLYVTNNSNIANNSKVQLCYVEYIVMFVSADITEGPLTTIMLMKQPLRLLTSLIALTASTAAILPITNTMTNLGIPLTGSTAIGLTIGFPKS